MAPTYHSYRYVLLPTLKFLGANIDYQVAKHGLFPDTVGSIKMNIQSMKEPLKSINLTERGTFKGLRVIVDSTPGKLWDYYKENFKPAFDLILKESEKLKDYPIDFIETCIDKPSYSKANTLCITAILDFEKPTMLTANLLLENKADLSKDHPNELLQEILKLLKNDKIVLDEHHADQMLVYMSLANSDVPSALSTSSLSLHS